MCVDPKFKAPAIGDLRLRPASAAINAGSTPLIALDWTDVNDANGYVEPMPWDLAVLDRQIGANVDMGAHEHCIGDVNGDNINDINDLSDFLSCYGFPTCVLPRPSCCLADFNEDGVVEITDLAWLLSNFGVNCNAIEVNGLTGESGGGEQNSTMGDTALIEWLQQAAPQEVIDWWNAGMPPVGGDDR